MTPIGYKRWTMEEKSRERENIAAGKGRKQEKDSHRKEKVNEQRENYGKRD